MSPLAYVTLALAAGLGLSRCQTLDARRDLAEFKSTAAQAAQKAENTYRTKEQALVEFATRTAHELHQAREKAAADTAALSGRLRERAVLPGASAATQAAAAACRDLDAPAVGVLPGPTREDLVDLAKRAEVTRQALLACQKQIAEDRRIVNGN